MIDAHSLPLINATLNGSAALFIVVGLIAIRRRRIAIHRACMVTALILSTAFMGSYLYYHALVGSVPFSGAGWPRVVYYAILFTHIPLAAAVVPLALLTAARAVRGKFEAHVRIARWTAPVWLYVSATGVLVYMFLYQWFGS